MNDFTKAIIVNVIALLLCSLILMGLWNWLMPVIFNLSTIINLSFDKTFDTYFVQDLY